MNILLKVHALRRGVGTTVKLLWKRNIASGVTLLQEEHEQVVENEVEDKPEHEQVVENEVEDKPEYESKKGEPIGFIGLGNMGSNMGMNLIKKGYNLVIYDISSKAMEPFKLSSAVFATSPEEVAQQVNTIVTMLPSSEDVKEVYEGNRGIFCGLQEGSLLIDSSTIDPSVSIEMSIIAAASYNSTYMDAPVSGSVEAAQSSELTFMCGGNSEDFAKAEHLLRNMGAHVVHCGAVGCGQSAKICNNMLVAISMIGTSEVMNLGMRLGLDSKALAAIINMSTGRCWASESYNPCPDVTRDAPASNEYQGGFASQHMAKDLGLAQNISTATKSSIPLGSQAHQIYNTMCKSGYSKLDFSSVYKFLKEL